ncbi:F-box domain protein [Raphanus sativus]|nr:F-box domain protein [Raphanus sativus]
MGFFGYYVRIRKRKVKGSKLCRRQVRVCKDVTRISDLSDELLIKILSFLPTKVAVSTSILSKQWQFLWVWLPKLEYSDHLYYYSKCSPIGEFIDKYLPLHKAPVIERLSLSLSVEPEDIKRWVEIAVSRYVRDLDDEDIEPDINIPTLRQAPRTRSGTRGVAASFNKAIEVLLIKSNINTKLEAITNRMDQFTITGGEANKDEAYVIQVGPKDDDNIWSILPNKGMVSLFVITPK